MYGRVDGKGGKVCKKAFGGSANVVMISEGERGLGGGWVGCVAWCGEPVLASAPWRLMLRPCLLLSRLATQVSAR